MATAPSPKPTAEEERKLTEEEYIALLKRRFKGDPLTSTPRRQENLDAVGVRAPDQSNIHYVPTVRAPKMPSFSGDKPPQKGDVTYQEWRFEVSCLLNDDEISHNQLVQAMRRSLRGTARKLLIPLGEKASVEDILQKLDVMFGDVSSKGMIMQEFFNATQRSSESVTAFGCRLETILQTAIDHDHIPRTSKNYLHKFWTGLYSEKLKSQTRHKYDTIADFDILLREIRQVDKELSLVPGSGRSAIHNPLTLAHQDSLEEKFHALEKQMDSKFQNQIESMEKRLFQKLDDKFATIIGKLDSMSTPSSSHKPHSSDQLPKGYGKPRWKRRWQSKQKLDQENKSGPASN